MNNMSKIIKGHSKKVTSIPRDERPKRNCRKKSQGNCQVNNVVYKCDVTRPLPKKVYLALAEVEWKSLSITTSYHLNTRDALIKQHFQVTCGT